MRMFAILVRFDLKDEAAARGFDALAEETIAAVQALEPETLIYVVHRVEDAPLSRVFYVREPGRARTARVDRAHEACFRRTGSVRGERSNGVPRCAKRQVISGR
jgi:hypothetical protein